MGFKKPERIKEGTKFLFYGEAGSGKTPTGLSFPKIAYIDSDSGTNFYSMDNVEVITNKLSFKELNADLDELEMDDDLFKSIQTFTVDSITRFYETMTHAMNKIAEKRAVRNQRDAEAEIMSFREYGKMKIYYDEFFARMLGYAKQGKHLVFIAEQKDKNENINGEIRKVGVVPNAAKDIEYDFDVVVRTYNDKEGNPKGIVEKDRTGTFKVGDIIDKPNYLHWKEAIEKALEGRERTKEEIISLEKAVKDEILDLDDGETLKEEIERVITPLLKTKKDEVIQVLTDVLGTHRFKTIADTKQLRKALEAVKKLQ